MLEYIERGKTLKEWPLCDEPADAYQYIKSIPAADVVARDCYNRILAENDDMRAQLEKIGKKPGDNMDDVRRVVLCHDCKHRFNYPICACRGDDWFCGYGEREYKFNEC